MMMRHHHKAATDRRHGHSPHGHHHGHHGHHHGHHYHHHHHHPHHAEGELGQGEDGHHAEHEHHKGHHHKHRVKGSKSFVSRRPAEPVFVPSVARSDAVVKTMACDSLRRVLQPLLTKHWPHMTWEDFAPALTVVSTEEVQQATGEHFDFFRKLRIAKGPQARQMALAMLKAKTEPLLRRRGVALPEALAAMNQIKNLDELETVVMGPLKEPGMFVERIMAGVPLKAIVTPKVPDGELDPAKIHVVLENRKVCKLIPGADDEVPHSYPGHLPKPGRLREFLGDIFGRKDGTRGLYGPTSAARRIYEVYTVPLVSETGRKVYAKKICLNFYDMEQSDTFAHCMDDLNFPQLAPLLELVPNLGAIRLSANRICNKSMKALAARLPSCIDPLTGLAGLQTLELTDNHIGDEGVGYLAEALPHLPELEELFLQVNRFADVGPLSLALPACSRLKELQLGGNRIACTGALALARALPRCPMLHILGLSGNVIADAGARAIASVLPSCKQLRKLMMKMNAFRETE